MEFWIGVTVAAIIGFALGAVVVWLVDRKRGGGTSVAALRQEHENFREQVTTHFVETADLINKLTDSYKDVFDHLSKGAEKLVDDKTLRDRMPKVSDQEVRLKRLGTRSSSGSQSDSRDGEKAKDRTAATTTGSGSSTASRPAAAARRTDAESGGGTSPARSGSSSGPGGKSSSGSSKGASEVSPKTSSEAKSKGNRTSSDDSKTSAVKAETPAKGSATAETARKPSGRP